MLKKKSNHKLITPAKRPGFNHALTLFFICRTIPFGWNLITSGYFELSVHGVCVSISIHIFESVMFCIHELTVCAMLQVVISTVSLLFMGKFLEPVWGSKEFLKFIFVVNFLTYLCVFVTAIALYYITRLEIYL